MQAQIFMAQASAQAQPNKEVSEEEKQFKAEMEKAASKVE